MSSNRPFYLLNESDINHPLITNGGGEHDPLRRYTSLSAAQPAFPVLSGDHYIVDTHCHLDMDIYHGDRESVIARANDRRVSGIVSIGIDPATSAAAVRLAHDNEAIRATVGIHPHGADDHDLAPSIQELRNLIIAHREVIVGLGEIGLDFARQYASPARQRALFAAQLGLAREFDLPIIVHDREAHSACLDILTAEGPFNRGGIMHCFSGDRSFARKVMDLNLHISIPGIVTFKNAVDLQDVAASIPFERMLLETDGPYLAPVPFRGKRNEPVYTLYTAAAVANLRQCSLDDVAAQTSQNACSLFGYDFSPAQRTSHD